MPAIATLTSSESGASGHGRALLVRPSFFFSARRRLELLYEIWNLPRVAITLGKDREGSAFYRWFTSRHPRLLLIRFKTWGIALQPVPTTLKEYLKGKERQALRTNMGHSKRAGFTARSFDPRAHYQDILDIYASSSVRQGRPVVFDQPSFDAMIGQDTSRFYGLFASDGTLTAFTSLVVTGELAWTKIFIGHTAALHSGIMYHLMADLIERLIDERQHGGAFTQIMFDAFYGNTEGMRYFIRRCGFAPCNVTWRLARTD